jgi:hypothetical protein
VSYRTFVFLNHATPEDNAFTTWLGARLTAAGYDVWSDVLKLGGGETFWNDINDGIRRRTALFIPILSPAAANPEKRGVHNEISIAMQVMRRDKLNNFILPVLLQYVPEVNPELIQLNYLDFSTSWATGLVRLLDRMEKLGVPRRDGPDRAAMDRWLAVQGHLAGALKDETSLLSSNWFEITSMPPLMRYVGTPAGRGVWDNFVKNSKLPMRAHMRLAATFAEPSELQMEVGPDIPIKTEYEMSTQSFMDGKPPNGMPALKGVDARRMIVDMLRQGWEAFAQSRGLKKHEMSGRTTWYMPEGLLPGDWAHFTTEAGKRARRKLVGIRGKRKIRYHFAVSARPQILPFPRLIIYAHVVFSEGGVLITSKSSAQRNRKALCKHWWNAEWRDRQTAMLTFLAQSAETFELPLGGVVATVSATPMQFEAPCSYVRHNADEAPEMDEEPDDFDETLADLDARSGPSDDGDDEEDE